LEENLALEEALDIFNTVYTEKTKGSVFGQPVVMKPGAYMPMDISYDESPVCSLEITFTESNIPYLDVCLLKKSHTQISGRDCRGRFCKI